MRLRSLKVKVIFYLMPLVLLVAMAFMFFYFSSMGYLGRGKTLELYQPEVIQGLSITGLIIILGLLVVWLLAEWIVRPIKSFIEGAEEVAKGNLDYQFNIKSGDEIGELSKTFNQMINNLRKARKEVEEARDILEVRINARTEELREVANSLDEQVKERTAELQQRIDELEIFHKLTVGRELKMIELKNEIQRLEKEKGTSKDKEPEYRPNPPKTRRKTKSEK